MNAPVPGTPPAVEGNETVSRTRLLTGGALFVGGFLSPLLIPLVTQSDLPAKWKAILSTGLVAGLPEVGMILAVAVLGKQGFELLKRKLFALLRKHTESAVVSAGRYRFGLVLFCLPLLVGWLSPYLVRFQPALSLEQGPLSPLIFMDLMFVFSFLVLGEDFWEKIRLLFIHKAPPGGNQV